ncbi:MAG: hypothetical protein HY055_14195 [Magnetospirillum sp.]|nr:hypothetical protein [Magnetospirillum sp.]
MSHVDDTAKRRILHPAIVALLTFIAATEQASAQMYCDPWPAADIAGKAATAAITANTTAVVLMTTESAIARDTLALQGFASQVSGNLRGAITAGVGLIAEAKSNQDTQRRVQDDRVAAIKAHQFSTPLCQAATGADIGVALAQASMADQILVSQANARRTGGYRRPESSKAPIQAGTAAFQERRALFCDPNDPACDGMVGKRPEGDRMPGAVLAIGRLENADDRAQAAWVANNLTMPLPVPALTERQLAQPGGSELYLRRGGWETQVNLGKDLTADILVSRRTPKAHAGYFNSLSAEAGLPQSRGDVSEEDMDRMRYRDRFSDKFTSRVASLDDPTVLAREWLILRAEDNAQAYRWNNLLEQTLLLNSSILSSIVEPKLASGVK